MRLTTLAAFVVLGCGSIARGDDVETWVKGAIAKAASIENDASFKAVYETRSLQKADLAEIERLRARVAGKPAHPDRTQLGMLERIERRGEDLRVKSLWWDRGRFRLSRDPGVEPEGGYFECVDLGDEGWKMSPQQLTVVGPMDTRPGGHNVRLSGTSSLQEIATFWAAGLSTLGTSGNVQVETTPQGVWRAAGTITTSVGERRVVVTGRWDQARQAGLVERTDAYLPTNLTNPIYSSVVTGHQWMDWFGAFVGTEVVITENGTPRQRLTLVSLSPLDQAEFRTLIARPKIDGSDPIRGKVTFTQYVDYRRDTPDLRVANEKGEFEKVDYPDTPAGRRNATLQTLGWIAAGGIIATLIALRIRSARPPS
jgi:hypothetical protein